MFGLHLAFQISGRCAVSFDEIFWGTLFHDIGKIAIPQSLLEKEETLSPDEWKVIRKHPVMGYEILENAGLTRIARDIVLYHHERWDGKGYPYGLAGKDIPLEARICALADAFEAMTSDRTYKKRMTYVAAYEELRREAGAQFDPDLVEVFLGIDPRDWSVLRQRASSERLIFGED
jgi:putative nucleotidyltransferase with HDIG domain